jgi:site-specific DNA-methyltransferase (adenine-specific)
MVLMARYPDKHFDLAIVDPPYGMKQHGAKNGGAGKLKNRAYNNGTIDDWDIAPTQEYFNELFRVSKNQIIWGGNYFDLRPTRCVLAWDKVQPWQNFSQWEMAWTSFGSPAQIFKFDNRTGGKIHPTQKPVQLYKWLLERYAEKGNRILDTHLGSGSIAIACHEYGYDLTACELDKGYYDAAMERITKHTAQLSLC